VTAAADALHAAAAFAVDPAGVGGVLLRAAPGPARDAWLQALTNMLPAPPRKLPVHVDDARLLGGLDLAATLQAGRPILQRGLLADADGGVLLLAMAERCGAGLAAKLGSVLDTGRVQLQRDGLAGVHRARLGLVALDEGLGHDEAAPAALADRLAIHLRLDDARGEAPPPLPDIAAARRRWAEVQVGDEICQALCEAAAALGIPSLRAPLLALHVTRAAAALAGRTQADTEDAAFAARLVLAPRARSLPAPPEAAAPPDAPEPPPASDGGNNETEEAAVDEPLPEQVLEAALSGLSPGLLRQLQAGALQRHAAPTQGRSGAASRSRRRGRPIGSERGDPRGGARLDLLATLRAAAPWQALRRRESGRDSLQVRRDDFHVRRFRERRETATVFVVDASGSAALHRLAEAKGAVELLLADCYVRRDRVALLAFRGAGAELLLPPTRSLPRARRCLAGLPGGGGTPLAAGIAGAQALAEGLMRQGTSTTVVLLTDGRANIARDGSPGRAAAQQDALAAARALRLAGVSVLLLDTSPQPQPVGRELATAMGARYLALPHADAAQLSHAVGAVVRR
jgi:magnesium chelatase subunit D